LLKRFWTLTVISAILVLAVMASAKTDQKVVVGQATVAEDNTIRVPLAVANGDNLVGIDIALKYSAGVKIKEVRFDNGRIADWDLKATILSEVNKTIVIMAVPQLSMSSKPALTTGDGQIAELVFEKTDPTANEIVLEPTVVENPHHEIFFVYAFTDNHGSYTQWREDPVFENGTVALATTASTVPREYALNQNFPNPFNPDTKIQFALPNNGHVQLAVYNVLGQMVRTLVDQDMTAGNHTVNWDGKNGDGQQVSSGIYFYRVSADNFSATKKMMMLK